MLIYTFSSVLNFSSFIWAHKKPFQCTVYKKNLVCEMNEIHDNEHYQKYPYT